MYYLPVFSFDCITTGSINNQPCPPIPVTPAHSLQQWFNGHGPPSGLQPNQTPGYPAWYQDLDTTLIWSDENGIAAWVPPFTPT